MNARFPAFARLALVCLTVAALGGCGGGGGSSGSGSGSGGGSGSTGLSAGGANVATVVVDDGPVVTVNGKSTTPYANFNIPYVTVKVCAPGASSRCATIDHVLVDTGSIGLRLMQSVVASLNLQPLGGNGATIGECLPFADGNTWGPVANADLYVGGEQAGNIPAQIVDDSYYASGGTADAFAQQMPASCQGAPPSFCQLTNDSKTQSLNSICAFSAKGILGVGLFRQDCGPQCANFSSNGWYYACSAGSCQPTAVPQANQVVNPVTRFATDNNGVVLQLPALTDAGAPSASGYLGFGIATESNNGLGGAQILYAAPEAAAVPGVITTTFNGVSYRQSIIDSGSNGYYFASSGYAGLTTCTKSTEADFYCPSQTLALTATNMGVNGGQTVTPFRVASFDTLSGANAAFSDIAGTAGSTTNGTLAQAFDWGLPFFYGRTVYFAIDGMTAASATGPFFAY